MDFQNLALKQQKRRRLWLAGSASALIVLVLAVSKSPSSAKLHRVEWSPCAGIGSVR